MAGQFDRSSVLRSAVLVTLSTYINYATGLVASILIARHLGAHEYGQYAYLIWLAGALTTLYCSGLTYSGIRFVSDELGAGDVDGARRVQRTVSRWFLACLVIISLIYVIASPWLLPGDWRQPGWIFTAMVVAAAATKAAYLFGVSIAKGYGRFEVEAHTTNLMSLLNIAGIVALVAIGATLSAYMGFFVVLCVGHFVLVRRMMARAGMISSDRDVSNELRSRIAQHAVWGALLFVVSTFSNKSFENVLLNSYVGPEAVGWFAIATAMARGGTDMLAAGLSSVLMPVMSHAFGSRDRERAFRIFSDSARYYFFLGLLLAGTGFLWAGPAISILYGPQYQQAILALQVMMVVGGIALFDGAAASILTTTDNQAARVGVAVLTLVATGGAAIAFIPTYGFVGALIAHAVSRSIYFLASMVAAVRLLECRIPYLELARAALAACVGIAIAASLLSVWSGRVAEIVAGAGYAVGTIFGSFVLRVWTKNDLKLVAVLSDKFPVIRRLEVWLSTHTRDA